MADEFLNSIFVLRPWGPVATSSARHFEEELGREMPEGHLLSGRSYRAAASSRERDDVLFQLDDGSYAVVHLTYSRKRELSPHCPNTRLFPQLADWMLGPMLDDHLDHFGL